METGNSRSDPQAEQASTQGRFVYVDVLRGIAILAVIVHHLPEPLSGPFGRLAFHGGRGVDLFFVLSGFLIGSTALTRSESGASPLGQSKAYWLLRTLRIWPLYFLVLGVYAGGLPGFDADAAFVLRNYPLHYLTFTSNDLAQGTLELGVLWSLAIEEQFYLVVGIIVMTCSRDRRTLSAAFLAVAVVAVGVALRMRFELWSLKVDHGLEDSWHTFRLYHSTLSRIDQLGLGLAAAVLAPSMNRLDWAQSARWSRTITWLAIASVVAIMLYFPQIRAVEFLLVGASFSLALLLSQRPAARPAAPHSVERPILRLMGAAGRLSFGLYLFHPLTRHWTRIIFDSIRVPLTSSVAVPFLALWVLQSWILAAVSYRFLEGPTLGWARQRANRFLHDSTSKPLADSLELSSQRKAAN